MLHAWLEIAGQPLLTDTSAAAAAAVAACLQVEAGDLQRLEERIRNINSMAQVK